MATNPNPKLEPKQAAPTLSVVPPPDALAVAHDKIEELTKAIAEALALNAQLAEEKQELAAYREEVQRNPLMTALMNFDAGDFIVENGDRLKELCAAVNKQEAKGVLTIEIEVKPYSGVAGALTVTPKVKVKAPVPAPAASIFFLGADGGLQRENPQQRTFKFGGSNPARAAHGHDSAFDEEDEREQRREARAAKAGHK